MAVDVDIVRHLLRRTEYVDRLSRVVELSNLANLEAAVDNVLDVDVESAGTAVMNAASNWQRAEQYTHFWLNRMAHDSMRPVRERVGFFLHGHFCSDLSKVESAELMRDQLDLFRGSGMGSLRTVAKQMAVQVAMLRYLDNNDNRRTSPNQNFGRELMELFLLGVGNYTEADVEASTAAWTGHTDNWETDEYVWRLNWHEPNAQAFLGQTINQGGDPQRHGDQVIDTILTNGVVPVGANAGRPTREVAAEFLSRKLWTYFAGTTAPPAVVTALRDVAIANDFAIKPWLKALLLRNEFYDASVRQGLVRTPVDYMVSLLVATGRRSEDASPLWLMEGMGQRPMFPPNVSGWRHNGYFVNASAMAERTRCAQMFFWRVMDTYWGTEGPNAGQVVLPGGTISQQQVVTTWRNTPNQLVDALLTCTGINPSTTSRNALYSYVQNVDRWDRINVILLLFLIPELHVS